MKKLYSGVNPESLDRGALANPDSLDWFVAHARAFRAERVDAAVG